jgi:uncharacterized Zn-finger protein
MATTYGSFKGEDNENVDIQLQQQQQQQLAQQAAQGGAGAYTLPPIKSFAGQQQGQQSPYSPLDTLTMAAEAVSTPGRPGGANGQQHVQPGQPGHEPMSIAALTAANPEALLGQMPMLQSIAGSALAASAAGGPPGSTKRPKRQCSQCHGWFSNLATHRSTHLADNSRPHACEVCGRGFARPNDLFRHQKSHRGDAPFRCPLFLKTSLYHDTFGQLEPSCHQNGGFSRCDTYKNHLKAMHFEYPAGTKKRDRSGVAGKCKGCGQPFPNADRWIAEHIETRQCSGIQKIADVRAKYEPAKYDP